MTEALTVLMYDEKTQNENRTSAAFCGSDKVSISFVLTTK